MRMRRTRTTAILAAALGTTAARSVPAERVIAGDGLVEVRVDGVAVGLRADPAAPGMPLLARPVAERVGLKMGRKLGFGIIYAVGPTGVSSSTATTKVDFGHGSAKRRVGWASRPFSRIGEGSIGPAGLPEPVIRFALRPPRPGERIFAMKMVKPGFPFTLFGGGWFATLGEIDVGGVPMRVRIDPYHPRTLATAGAAVRLARAHGGTISGEAVPTEIFFGVERPVRTLSLTRPLTIGSLPITTLGVRVQDDGNATAIREAGAVAPAADPDEVVVTAKGKRDTRRDTLSLGSDVLDRCSSIVFDKPALTIRLTCA